MSYFASGADKAGPFMIPIFLGIVFFGPMTLPGGAMSQPGSVNVNENWYQEHSLKLKRILGGNYVDLLDIVDALDLRYGEHLKSDKVVLHVGSKQVTVAALNPFVIVDGKTVQMNRSTRVDGRRLLVPVPEFVDAVGRVWPGDLRISNGKLLVSRSGANVLGILVEEKVNGTLIRIPTSRKFKTTEVTTRLSEGWLYVDVYGGILDTASIRQTRTEGAISRVIPTQNTQVGEIAFKLRRRVRGRKVYISDEPREIQVSLRESEAVPQEVQDILRRERQKSLIDTIVLDPGHGGRDPGAIGPHGLYEKDVTLAVAKRLKKQLERKLKVRVLMTRDDDRFVPLKKRTQFANRNGGKLFISIHANSNPDRRVRGVTTYFLGVAKTKEALEAAQLENSAIRYEEDPEAYQKFTDEEHILLAISQNEYNRESQDLAAMIQKEMAQQLKVRDRGVKQAGYYVLVGSNMPNILIEAAFISNRSEEKLLRSKSFQQKVAVAVSQGMIDFKKRYEQAFLQ